MADLHCDRCGRPLRTPASRLRGRGPTCDRKDGLTAAQALAARPRGAGRSAGTLQHSAEQLAAFEVQVDLDDDGGGAQ